MPKKLSEKSVKKVSADNYLSKLETEIQTNQSKISLVLGALIVLVIGILVFNYFSRSKPSLGPAQQTEQAQQSQSPTPDVAPSNLPGPYTVKDGDTLYLIAQKYYQDGNRFEDIAKANNINNPDEIETGQVLKLPKLEAQAAPAPSAETITSPTPESSAQPTPTPSGQPAIAPQTPAADNTTPWGPKIETATYTVVEGDWLSKIAGRAYGDILAYHKIAQANNIANPDHIEAGWVLTIPR